MRKSITHAQRTLYISYPLELKKSLRMNSDCLKRKSPCEQIESQYMNFATYSTTNFPLRGPVSSSPVMPPNYCVQRRYTSGNREENASLSAAHCAYTTSVRRISGFGVCRKNSHPRTGPWEGCNVIHPMNFDATAEAEVERWFEERSTTSTPSGHSSRIPSVEITDVKGTALKKASLLFEVNGKPACAVGFSQRKAEARILCFMHALQLLRAFQSTFTILPPPLKAMELHKGPFAFAKPPELSSDEKENLRYFLAYKIPPSSNSIVNEATEIMEKQCSIVDLNAISKLNNVFPDSSSKLIPVKVAPNVFVTNLCLVKEANLFATGVANKAKLAKIRCATHALQIIRLCKQEGTIFGEPQKKKGKPSASTSPGLPHPSLDSISSILMTLSNDNQLLLRFLSSLYNLKIERNFECQKETQSEPLVQCTVQLGEISCTCEGGSYYEAQRSAFETCFSQLRFLDQRAAAVTTLIAQYPSLIPESMPIAKLPQSLRDKIEALCAFEKRTFSAEDGLKEGRPHEERTEDFGMRSLGAEKPRSPSLSENMKRSLHSMRAQSAYLNDFHVRRSTLPIAPFEGRIIETIRQNPVTVIAGTTGCGKTTQVPQYILDDMIERGEGDRSSILVSQSRRLSTFNVAHRIASERLSSVGQDVGYAVRLDTIIGKHLNICTSGVLLQVLMEQPDLRFVSHVILDEVHDRDVNCDVILALVRELLKVNPSIRIILMSATIEADMFAHYFGNAPVIRVDGSVFPVSIFYLDGIHALLRGQAAAPQFERGPALPSTPQNKLIGSTKSTSKPPKPNKNIDYLLIATLVYHSWENYFQSGWKKKSIIVFLPGWKELISARKAIQGFQAPPGAPRCHIILLHSSVDASLQHQCFLPPPEGMLKVILATNIAESGITIDDAAVVIDTGLIKEAAWAHHSRHTEDGGRGASNSTPIMTTQLTLKYASRANLTQRSGRAGRTQGGVCFRLFTKEEVQRMREFPEAEIHRVPLSQVLLKCFALQHEPKTFLREFIEPPDPTHVAASIDQLHYLGAIRDTRTLTPLGLHLSRLPCDPRMGKIIILGSILHCLDSALTVAACTGVDPFSNSRELQPIVKRQRYILSRQSYSDHIASLNAYNAFFANNDNYQFAELNCLSVKQLSLISQYKCQYKDILIKSGLLTDASLNNAAASTVSDGGESSSSLSSGRTSCLFMDQSPYSSYSQDIALIKGCIASCLFPNIAVFNSTAHRSGKQKMVLSTRTISSVSPGGASVCRRLIPALEKKKGGKTADLLSAKEILKNRIAPMFYVYEDVFRVDQSKTQFLRNVSSISLWALLLFCGTTDNFLDYHDALEVGVIEKWIGIRIDKETYQALKALRCVLDRCLHRKFQDPLQSDNNAFLDEVREVCRAVLITSSKSLPESKITSPCGLDDFGSVVFPFSEKHLLNSEEVHSEKDEQCLLSNIDWDSNDEEFLAE